MVCVAGVAWQQRGYTVFSEGDVGAFRITLLCWSQCGLGAILVFHQNMFCQRPLCVAAVWFSVGAALLFYSMVLRELLLSRWRRYDLLVWWAVSSSVPEDMFTVRLWLRQFTHGGWCGTVQELATWPACLQDLRNS